MSETDTIKSIRVPRDVGEWLKAIARRNTSNMQAEIIRSVRDRMEREKVKAAGLMAVKPTNAG